MVAMLLEMGAETKEKDFMERDCKTIAERYKHARVVQILSMWDVYGEIPAAYKTLI